MNWKAALLIVVVFFAFSVTATAISLNAAALPRLYGFESTILDGGIGPTGEPIGGGGFPH